MDVDQLYEIYQLKKSRKRYERWRFFIPVAKQEEFLFGGADPVTGAERMLMAGNGNGKTETAAFEVALHLTGNYPVWWRGYRFDKPIRAWVGGTSGRGARSAGQEKLFGTPGDPSALGTGLIPKDSIVGTPATGRSAPNSIDSAIIKHISGGNSRVELKTYSQQREDWQGSDIELVWFDEEPPMEIYTEGLARLRGKGIAMTTFTPLHGITDLVKRFTSENNGRRLLVRMRLSDAVFMTPEQVAATLEMYPVHEREARLNGMPMLGEGAVFSTPSENLAEPRLSLDKVPLWWPRLWAIDFGINHPFAAVLFAFDRDADCAHILRAFRLKGMSALHHTHALRQIAANVPVAWPHDGTAREKGSGEPLAKLYRDHGLNMLAEHATFQSGGYSTEAGVQALEVAMTEGRFKVDATLTEWFEEYSSYHRKDGNIVKVNDDLLSATRIGYMMRRAAKSVPFGSKIRPRVAQGQMADGVDFAIF